MREIVTTVVTWHTAPCAFCNQTVRAGQARSKVWRKGMKTTRRQKNGPGMWMHPECATRWVKGEARP